MKYYIPKIQLGLLSKKQISIEDKFGGLPWGLPKTFWPICKACNKPMCMIAQLVHNEKHLNLGKEGRCLYVFMCANPDSMCESTWDSSEGCNASFVLEPENIDIGITYPANLQNPESAEIRTIDNSAYNQKWDPENTIWIETEVRITAWVEKDDGIPEEQRNDFLSRKLFWNIDDSLHQKVNGDNKLGSVPYWLQEPEEKFKDWIFVGQFSGGYSFHTPLPEPNEVGCPVGIGDRDNYQRLMPDTERVDAPREILDNPDTASEDDPIWFCGGPNFGDGKAYVFIDQNQMLPKCEFIWQCS